MKCCIVPAPRLTQEQKGRIHDALTRMNHARTARLGEALKMSDSKIVARFAAAMSGVPDVEFRRQDCVFLWERMHPAEVGRQFVIWTFC